MSLSVSIWGDSIMKGVIFDSVKRKYVFLRESAVSLFSKRFSIPIKNHSRFGCTAPRAFTPLIQSLEKEEISSLVLLEFGGNDCDYNWREVSKAPLEKHDSNTSIELFEETLRKMICAIRAAKARPITMSLPPIHAGRYFDFITSDKDVEPSRILDFLTEKELIYRHQELYSNLVCRISREMSVPLVDVRTLFLKQKQLCDFLCMDGIHPNEKGQQLIQDALSKVYSLNV
ncbi:MAG: SGNH/GDSL hydrolase family protein [Clostridiales bacterium]|nr:SGNH/GDSL hydrolase family protein [Clostridiales bacterium]